MTDQNNYDYDVLYIGAGHGTFDGAIPLAQSGAKVGVIEADMIGGTCPNYGCNAKITLDAPVALTRAAERLQGVVEGKLSINWTNNEAHKDEVISPLPTVIGGLLEQSGIDVIHGTGSFKNRHTVVVDGQEKTADNIVIATGLRPHRLDIPGSELAHDSRDFMSLKQLPQRIAIVGSGYISMEFATMANASGAQVTVLMHGDQALREFNQPYVEQVISDLDRRGVTFIRSAGVSAFEQAGDHLRVQYGDNQNLDVDWILDATGRIPNVEHLGLDAIGVRYTEHGVEVNDRLQTSVDNIYASGDVIDKSQPKLTPTAIVESTYLFHRFSDHDDSPLTYPVIPSVVFTSPRIAKAGVSVDEAQQRGYKITTNHLPDGWYRQVDKETIGDNALIFDADHHLVGATEISDQAPDAINTLLPAIEFKFGASELSRLVYLFPTISADAMTQL